MSDRKAEFGSAKKQCLRATFLGYLYADNWRTPIHKFARDNDNDSTGFLTGNSDFLKAGEGKTLGARAHDLSPSQTGHAELPVEDITDAGNTYDARIYSHFTGGRLNTVIGPVSTDHENHTEANHRANARRFLARAVELEVNLYLDSLYFWTLAHMHPTGEEPPWAEVQIAPNVLDWWKAEQQYWREPVPSKSARGSNAALNAFEALATSSIQEVELALSALGSNSRLQVLVDPESGRRNVRFWAEGVCETVRETTLFRTGIPRLMQAIVTNIPGEFWVLSARFDPDQTASQLLKWTAASFLLHFQRVLRQHIAGDNDGRLVPAEKHLAALLKRPTEEARERRNLYPAVHPAQQVWVDELILRIDNINELMAKHALLLHEIIHEEFIINSETFNEKLRQVDGIRPNRPHHLFCFQPPGRGPKRNNPCNASDCNSNCKSLACTTLPCRSLDCRDNEVQDREFMRQLREQQATLNGTDRATLSDNHKAAIEHGTGAYRQDSVQDRAREVWLDDQPNADEARDVLSSWRQKRLEELLAEGKTQDEAATQLANENRNALWSRFSAVRKSNPQLSRMDAYKAAAKELAEERYSGLAALHALDIIAGGNASQILGLGDARINSSLGSQWNHKREALREALEGTSEKPNIELVVCPRPCPADPKSPTHPDNKKTATPTTP